MSIYNLYDISKDLFPKKAPVSGEIPVYSSCNDRTSLNGHF